MGHTKHGDFTKSTGRTREKPLRYLAPTAFPVGAGDVRAAFRNGMWDASAAHERFSHAMANRLDVAAVYPTASGRTALALLLRALVQGATEHRAPAHGAAPGHAMAQRREVILPAYTCPSLVKVILDADLVPRLVDMVPETLSFAPDALACALGERTLAVIFVHPFGLALDMRDVARMARDAGAILIEDAAQALGARANGRPVGAAGDYGIFSLGPGKPLAVGGGGFLTRNHASFSGNEPGSEALSPEGLHGAWERLAAPGLVQAAWSVAKLALVGMLFHPWGWRVAAAAGINRAGDSELGQSYGMYKMTGPQAAAAHRLLEVWEGANRRRRKVARDLTAALQHAPNVIMPNAAACPAESVFLRFPILAPDEATRDAWFEMLQRQGVGAGKMYGRTLAQRYPVLGESRQDYPGAEALARRLLTLPTHHYVTEQDVEAMADALSQA